MEDFSKKYNLSDAELFAPANHDELASEKITAPRYSYWKSVFRVFFRNRVNIVVLSLLAILIAFAFIYPVVIGYDPEVNPYLNLTDMAAQHLNPKKAIEHFGFNIKWLFGTSGQGASTFDSIWHGSRLSIMLAVVCAAINMTIGIILGAVWGFSRKVDIVMNEVYNVLGNIPMTLLISVMVLVFSPSFWTLVFAMTVIGWLGMAYYIRTRVIIIRDHEYNLASRCLGTNIFKIAIKNILPFMTSVIVLEIASAIPGYISYEVFLSYIGLGINQATLGRLIQEAQNAMSTPGWGWEFWSPVAVASVITVVLYVVGQNLGDASDPRTHM
ncbi:MAG: ABC transporter permease [bacterium]|nr:ABC transporter permease [bacterium]MCM1375583.1 ABC transporter permease [Muribaculum sp.]